MILQKNATFFYFQDVSNVFLSRIWSFVFEKNVPLTDVEGTHARKYITKASFRFVLCSLNRTFADVNGHQSVGETICSIAADGSHVA